MNQIILLIISVLLLGLVAGSGVFKYYCNYGAKEIFCNIAEGVHAGNVSRSAEVAFKTRYLLGKKGAADNQVNICGAADDPLGVVTDEPALGDNTNVRLLGSAGETQRMVASKAMTVGDKVYTAVDGKVQDEPAAAGIYYRVGTVLSSPAAADGGVLEVETHPPIKVNVLATLANITALAAALSSPAEIKVL